MNYVLCNLNQMQYHVYLLQKKKSEDKFIPYIYFGDDMVHGVYLITLV